MTIARSAGVLLYRERDGLEVLLVHPGGPFWHNKDMGAWQIPKGGIEADEDAPAAARREVAEELGVTVIAPLQPLGSLRQAGGKRVEAYAAEQDVDADAITSITFDLEWPPRSGRVRSYPEVDRARWFPISEAAPAMLASQRPLLDRLVSLRAGTYPQGDDPAHEPSSRQAGAPAAGARPHAAGGRANGRAHRARAGGPRRGG